MLFFFLSFFFLGGGGGGEAPLFTQGICYFHQSFHLFLKQLCTVLLLFFISTNFVSQISIDEHLQTKFQKIP